jgi:F0F1-type ATP synthase membrane subunit b/b'
VVRKAVKNEAEKLIQTFGNDAYDKAREAMQDARRRRNARLERYLANVVQEIARQSRAVSD